MSKSVEEIAGEILIALIAKSASAGIIAADSKNAAEAFKVIHQAVNSANKRE